VDEGLPIAYQVLEEGVMVFASDGASVGTVDHVVAAPEKDIFHGIVILTGSGPRFVAAQEIDSLHERGVDLLIDAAAANDLPEPGGAAPARRVSDPGIKPSRWKHIVDMLSGADPHRRDWSEEK
jgi:hypothetical protein